MGSENGGPGPATPALGRVLITGASGFVGGRVVEALSLSGRGAPVAAIRHWSRAPRVARYAVEIVLCDLLERESLRRAASGADAVVHCAYGADRRSIEEGTRNVVEAAAAAGVRRVVHLSSAEVYGPAVEGEISERHATEPTGRDYADAKIAAEAICRESNSDTTAVTILRPSLVYGPFSRSWSIDLAARLQSGNWGTFGGHGEGLANLVYVDDLVRAILLCLEIDGIGGAAFNVNGPDRLTWNEYFEWFNAALGLPPLPAISATRSRLRTALMDSVGRLADLVRSRFEDRLMKIYLRGGWASRAMKRLKGRLDSTPSGNELANLYSRRAHYDDTLARRRLGYRPQFDIHAGLRMTTAWLRLHELCRNLDTAADDAASLPERREQVAGEAPAR